ncbi:MAG: 30S ribosome-binding factor RbfA [Phycisphaerales bacterium]|nr:30S ribosome-binding factor RbfA [Phycisphaerales bacterium]
MSVRADQIAAAMRRGVQDVITRGLNDPRVRGLVSVTRVTLSIDFADAVVYVSVLPEDASELSLHGLRHAAPFIRSELAKRVQLRRIPRIEFRIDRSLKKEAEVLAALAALDLAEPASPDPDHAAPDAPKEPES